MPVSRAWSVWTASIHTMSLLRKRISWEHHSFPECAFFCLFFNSTAQSTLGIHIHAHSQVKGSPIEIKLASGRGGRHSDQDLVCFILRTQGIHFTFKIGANGFFPVRALQVLARACFFHFRKTINKIHWDCGIPTVNNSVTRYTASTVLYMSEY